MKLNQNSSHCLSSSMVFQTPLLGLMPSLVAQHIRQAMAVDIDFFCVVSF